MTTHAEVQLVPAGPADRARLGALAELYVYDFSELLGLELREDGRFDRPPFEAILDDPARHAFLVRAGGHLAGFALVDGKSRLGGDSSVRDLAEFFVVRRHRRAGVGARAAALVFDRFPGRWEVRQRVESTGATDFWRKVIGRYTDGRFTEEVLDDARWHGPVQRFATKG